MSLLEHKWYHCITHIVHICSCRCWQHVVFADACRAFVFAGACSALIFTDASITLYMLAHMSFSGCLYWQTLVFIVFSLLSHVYARPLLLDCMPSTCLLLVCLALLPHKHKSHQNHQSLHALLFLHHMHCSHFITYTAITSSHTLLFLHHMNCYYFITCTVLSSSHALLLLHHMHCSQFITCTPITSSHPLPSFLHMHCYHFITCTVITSSHALLSYARPSFLACLPCPYFLLVCLAMLPHTRTQWYHCMFLTGPPFHMAPCLCMLLL